MVRGAETLDININTGEWKFIERKSAKTGVWKDLVKTLGKEWFANNYSCSLTALFSSGSSSMIHVGRFFLQSSILFSVV
jgi:hypothetical protein